MVAVEPLYPVSPVPAEQEPRIVLNDIAWATYVMLRDSIESAAVRMTYLEGVLEIMSPSRSHEVEKKQVARLLELFCLERDIPLFAYGSTTFRKEEKLRGLEPDECYCRDADGEIPDIALEVVKTHGAIDKLEVYRGLGIREVWVLEKSKFRILTLSEGAYVLAPRSAVLPEVDLDRIAVHAQEVDQHTALKAFRDELRATAK